MGLVRIVADDGTAGHAFLGSALGTAQGDAAALIQRFKPLLVGEDALARQRIWQTMMRRSRGPAAARHRRRGRGVVGSGRAGRPASPSTA